MEKLTIDRFEGDLAVCETENEDFVEIPRSELPKDAKEGSIISGQCGAYEVDTDATAQRRALIAGKLRELFDK